MIKSRNIVEVGYNIQATADTKYNLLVDVFAGGVNDMYELGRAAKKGNRPQKEPGFRKSDFEYDIKMDAYKCPAGNYLNHEISFKRGSTKKPYKVKRYGTKACSNCTINENCTTSELGRKIERPIHQPYIDRNNKRVTRYKDFYRTRQEIIEHHASGGQAIFGTWKRHWGMNHTIVNGKAKVEAEYRLAAISYNLLRTVSILGMKKLRQKLEKLDFYTDQAIRALLGIYATIFSQKAVTYY